LGSRFREFWVYISDVELRLFVPIFPSDGHPPRVPSPDPSDVYIGFRVKGSGFRVQGLGFGFKV
jgi:hypothetical protein